MTKKILLLLMACVIAVLPILPVCALGEAPGQTLDTAKIGVATGTTGEAYVLAHLPNATTQGFTNIMDAVAALKAGKVDAVVTANITAMNVAQQNPDLELLPEKLTEEKVCAGMRKSDTAMLAQINAVIKELQSGGTLAEMEERWLNGAGATYGEIPVPNTEGETLKVGIAANRVPFVFMDEHKNFKGYAPELAMRIGQKLERHIEFVDLEFASLIAALQSGKIDIIIDLMSWTEGRAKQINFSESYYLSGQVVLRRKSETVSSDPKKEDYIGKRIAVQTGLVFEELFLEHVGEAEFMQFNNNAECIEAVKTGKADAAIEDEPILRKYVARNPELTIIKPPVSHDEYGIMVTKEKPELRDKLNEFQREIAQDGTYDDMIKRWVDTATPPAMPDIPEATASTGEVLKAGVTLLVEPFGYYGENKQMLGFDVEYIKRFAAYADMKVEFTDYDFSSRINAVVSGKADICAGLVTITEERKKAVDFADPYYIGGTSLVILDKTPTAQAVSLQNKDFVGKKFAILTGSVFDQILDEHIGGNTFLYFNSIADIIEAVKTGKVDATLNDEPVMRKFLTKNPELMIITPPLTDDEYAFTVKKGNTELAQNLNEFLKKLKADGIYDDMVNRWINSKDTPTMPDIPLTGTNGTLKLAVTSASDPFVYYGDGELVGFDIEYARRFAQYMNMDLQATDMDFSAILPAVQSGKADFASSLIIVTEERKKSVDFADPHYVGGTSIVALNPAATTASKGFVERFKESFYNNLIHENRYRMVFEGLGTTLLISLCSLVLGTILGFGICFLNMSKRWLPNAIAKVYIYLLRGTPMVVLLMITFYVVFAKVDISPVFVAIIAFSLNGGAFIGEIIRTAILTVDKGQVEAARSIGFSKTGAFFTVTLPQAARVALPVYKSEFISLVKSTAIVGYISIVDLTKVGDIIRSRTFDAYFPLIMVAAVYLITIGVFIWLFDLLDKLTDKRLRRAA